jgi:hypothetical protein
LGLTAAKTELENQNTLLTTQQTVVDGLTAKAQGYEDRMAEIKLLVENETYQLEQQIFLEEEKNRLIQERIDLLKGIIINEPLPNIWNIPESPGSPVPEDFLKGLDIWNVNPSANTQGQLFPPPVKDTGGIVEGPGLFRVGAGVKEIVRYPDGNAPGSSGGVTININNPVIREEQDIQKLAKAISREQSRLKGLRNG